MTHPSGYAEVEKTFRDTEYGQVLSEKVRYDKYRHPSISPEEWVGLLGRDVSNLEHLSLTRGIALAFVRHSRANQPDLLDAEDELVLPLTASLHDWGEAITGDISYGDKTKEDDVEEARALDVVANSVYSGDSPALLDQAKAVVFDHDGESERGKIFFTIECLGYLRTAMNAMDHVMDSTAPEVQIPGLQWLYTDVVTNVIGKMVSRAKDYDAVHAALVTNASKIDQAFALIDSHPEVFDNYGERKEQKIEGSLLARETWEQFCDSLVFPSERSKPAEQRIPTHDSFGDGDEALMWVFQRLSVVYKQDGVSKWWTGPHNRFNGESPASVWSKDPNRIIKIVSSIEI